ncbi:hypothetical protein R5R35_008407 [Gryllus longicercus]|uniref:Kazal-like domain-containing protein n=1 Tax=Gryllus longicercus TaxID=2509291 RepID=A0AAN9VNW0_9ORTH
MRPSLQLLGLVLAALLALLVAGTAAQGAGRCNDNCPPRKPGEPLICATDGTYRVQFNNYCAMKLHNCLYGNKFRYQRRGPCKWPNK